MYPLQEEINFHRQMRVGCVYIPDYPARALLRQGEPPPLAVVDQGEIHSAGGTARARGVEPKMRVDRARTLCDDLTLHPRDRALESALWEQVERVLNTTTPYVERKRLGLSVLRPHDTDRLQSVVKSLRAQAGLGPARIDAQLAARKAGTGKMLEISAEYQKSFRQGLEVDCLVSVGVDPEIVERLRLFGYETVAAVASLSKRHLRAQFGESGSRLHDRLHASTEPSVSVYTPPPTIERTHRFERSQRDLGSIQTAVDTLIEDAVTALDGRTTQRITLRLRGRAEEPVIASRILRDVQSAVDPLQSTAHTLLKERFSTDTAIREVDVVLGALEQADVTQQKLFYDRPEVKKAVKTVHERYPGILRQAVLDRDAVFAEDRLRYEPVTKETSSSDSRSS